MVVVTELPDSLLVYSSRDVDLVFEPAIELAVAYKVPDIFVPDIAYLIECGVLGDKARKDGWDNVGEHCVLAGNTGLGITYLEDLEPTEAYRVCSYLYRHDGNLRKQKEAYGSTSTRHAGEITRIDTPDAYYRDHELSSEEDFIEATSMDWRGYHEGKWTKSQKIIRYVDSIVGPEELPGNQYGRDCLQRPEVRTRILHERKRPISEEIGQLLYGGTPAFIDLAHVTSQIEQELFEEAQLKHRELFMTNPERYTDSHTYFDLAKDVLDHEIAFSQHPLLQI